MNMSHAAEELFRQRSNFIIIGLTGCTGSGCTTVANRMINPDHFTFPDSLPDKLEDKKKDIIRHYSNKNWKPFQLIKVRDIITTYLLECTPDNAKKLLKSVSSDIHFDKFEKEFTSAREKAKALDPLYKGKLEECNHDDIHKVMTETLPLFTEKIQNFLDEITPDLFIRLYQKIGNNIRSYADAEDRDEIFPEHVFSLAQRINKILKSLRRYNEANNLPDFFIIDSIRNPAEVRFFQERYSSFYLWAIKAPITDRHDRLIHNSKMRHDEIVRIDKIESTPKNPLKNHQDFISQDIPSCIELADIHITNTGDNTNNQYAPLHYQLAKYFSLIHHPGLIMPTDDERNMQLAYTAKLNSGCLSRQVGAAVTDEYGVLLSLGWNEAPTGQTPCKLRTARDLVEEKNEDDFSLYERTKSTPPSAHQAICDKVNELALITEKGLPEAYCFKNIQNNIDRNKNQVHTRAVHAEENAFLALVGRSYQDKQARLYTTASPCVLCAKKAYQLGIKEIQYIDPYPDITFDHILNCGTKKPKLILFTGAVGEAYNKIYKQIIPYKDEINAYSS